MVPAAAAEVRARSRGEVTWSSWGANNGTAVRGGLFDAAIFGAGWEDPTPHIERLRVESEIETFVPDIGEGYFGHLELAAAIDHPVTGEPIDVIAVVPPALRPIRYLHRRRFAASDINDLYLGVIAAASKLRRLRRMEPEFPATQLSRAVEALMWNATAAPVQMPDGRPLRGLADHLRLGGKQPVRAVLWGMGISAHWDDPSGER
jgi:DNA-directed RNA polymerase beta' subunit